MQAIASHRAARLLRPGRVLLLLLPLAAVAVAGLAGCASDAPPPPQAVVQPDYTYLTKLRLNVANIAIDDSWTPQVGNVTGRHVESLSPVQPIDALRRMGQDRLVAQGTSGQARFIITDASILALPGRLDGSFAVRLEVSTSDGKQSGFAEARVVRTRTLTGDETDGGRDAAYDLVRRMMDDMNVEFEFQIRHSLREYLLSGAGIAAPAAVQSQDLGTPGATPAAAPPQPQPPPPAATAPDVSPGVSPGGQTLSPPPGFLTQPAPAYQPTPYQSTPYQSGPTPLSQ